MVLGEIVMVVPVVLLVHGNTMVWWIPLVLVMVMSGTYLINGSKSDSSLDSCVIGA